MPDRRVLQIVLSSLLASAFAAPLAAQDAQDCDAYRSDAEAGLVDSQLDLAICLLDSEDEADRKKAVEWGNRAMEAGNVEAKNLVAVAYVNGVGVKADPKRGQALMEEAADEGSFGARLTLAEHYIKGGGFYAQDPARGLALLTDVAEGGSVKGDSLGYVQWRIGMMHLQGNGTAKNDREAFRWVAKGAANGSTSALISHAVMLATGEGVEEDDPAARESYRRAIGNKDEYMTHALRGLGSMLYYGEGGPVDRIQGCAFLNIAYRGGDKNAETILDRIAPELTKAEQSACNKGAQDWIDANLKGRG